MPPNRNRNRNPASNPGPDPSLRLLPILNQIAILPVNQTQWYYLAQIYPSLKQNPQS